MKIPLYQVDTFTRRVLAGNPAAVCPLPHWLDDARLQAMAAEHNLGATAFFVADREPYRLRWFSPTQELELCGHGTLASAHVVLTVLEPSRRDVAFDTQAGLLRVCRDGERLAMDLPAEVPVSCAPPAALVEGLGRRPVEVYRARDHLAVFARVEDVQHLVPELARLRELDTRGVIVTAPGTDADFVSRFFAPRAGIPEDPVTGSAHCMLAPYWARRLGRPRLHARQVSSRGGELVCEHRGDRVVVAGHAVRYLEGTIDV